MKFSVLGMFYKLWRFNNDSVWGHAIVWRRFVIPQYGRCVGCPGSGHRRVLCRYFHNFASVFNYCVRYTITSVDHAYLIHDFVLSNHTCLGPKPGHPTHQLHACRKPHMHTSSWSKNHAKHPEPEFRSERKPDTKGRGTSKSQNVAHQQHCRNGLRTPRAETTTARKGRVEWVPNATWIHQFKRISKHIEGRTTGVLCH